MNTHSARYGYVFILVFALGFAAILNLPWFPSKSGVLYPINVAYTTPREDWGVVLVLHVGASLLIAGLFCMLCYLVTRRRT